MSLFQDPFCETYEAYEEDPCVAHHERLRRESQEAEHDALEDRLERAEALAERLLIFGELDSPDQVEGFMHAVGRMTTDEAETFLARETERRDMEEIGVTPDPRP